MIVGSSIPEKFSAVRTHVIDGKTVSRLEKVSLGNLTAGEVVVRPLFAGLNFKDCLSLHGRARIITKFPRIAGIELVGEVVTSSAATFSPGDRVLVHGFQTGIEFDGAFAEYVRIPAAHLLPIPPGLTATETAILGVAGFTVAMAVEMFQSRGIDPARGPIAVSGAGGGVGLVALGILAKLGYEVVAVTRRGNHAGELIAAGASHVVETSSFKDPPKPLLPGRFAAALDNVGGPVLSWLLSCMKPSACVASIGNAAGNSFDGNVIPFILRAVELVGIVANPPMSQRMHLWENLAGPWKPDFDKLYPRVRFIRLDELLATSERQLAGESSGRTLVDFRAVF